MNDPSNVQVIDLSAAARSMDGKLRSFAKVIEQSTAAHSAYVDLYRAAMMMENITLLRSKISDAGDDAELDQISIASNFISAIVLYARATKTRSRHRPPLDLTPYFSAKEKIDHQWICELRDDALAHYGPGEIKDGFALHRELALLMLGGATPGRVCVVSQTAHPTDDVRDRLSTQIEVAKTFAKTVIGKRERALAEAFSNLKDPAVVAVLLTRFKTTLGKLFVDHPIAKMIATDDGKQRETGIVWADVDLPGD